MNKLKHGVGRMKMHKGEVSLDGFIRGRAAFYGKCGSREVEGTGVKILRSYETEYYAAAYNGRVVILTDWYTDTSARHLEAFAAFANCPYHGKNGIGKKDPYNWHNLPRIPRNVYFFDDKSCAGAVMATVDAIKATETDTSAA